MKKSTSLISLLLLVAMLLTSCFGGNPGDGNPGGGVSSISALPFPDGAFTKPEKQSVIGSIVQTGDGNAYVSGTVPSPSVVATAKGSVDSSNKHLVTLEHAFGYSCYVSGYIGNSLYIIQDFGSLAWNKKGVGHKDGTILLDYGEDGYFSISSFSENKIIVGNPTDEAVVSLWDNTESYLFGYMTYDPETKELKPLYEENNLRFYTAGYFINGVAQVSVKEGDDIRFGIIDAEGNYVVEPTYGMMADERIGGNLIVAEDATGLDTMWYSGDNCGRNIGYDSTLMTNVQKARHYSCGSKTVGIINAVTGESILPCNYSYVERVMDSTYFVIDNDGNRFFFDSDSKSFSEIESGTYTYYNSEWMLYITEDDTAYLADKSLELYDATGLDIEKGFESPAYNANNLINANIITAERNEAAGAKPLTIGLGDAFAGEYDINKGLFPALTVKATGDVIYNVNSFTYPYNGGFLYTSGNSVYRYDMVKRESKRIETGYGDFTESYDFWIVRYYTSIHTLSDGVYILRYNGIGQDGQTYFMVIVNDMGEVLFDTAINSVENLTKNYLGRYDDALYELAGNTNIEDNYFLTRDDGSHFLLQFVRGELGSDGEGAADSRRYIRRVDSLNAFSYLSPFMLDFTNGSSITVSIGDRVLSDGTYVYDSSTQSLRILMGAIDFMTHEKMREDGYTDITVTAGGETITLKIEVSPFAFRF